MALTITERFKYEAGGKRFVYVSITHDESTSTFTAASVGLTYVDHLADLGRYSTTDAANTSVLLMHFIATILNDGTVVDVGYPMKAGSKSHHLLIGW